MFVCLEKREKSKEKSRMLGTSFYEYTLTIVFLLVIPGQ